MWYKYAQDQQAAGEFSALQGLGNSMNTAVESNRTPRLALKERKASDVMRGRPTTGEHKKIVRAAAFEAAVENRDLFLALSKI